MSGDIELPAADEPYCYLTTRGRRTGRPHRIEIWFARAGRTIYLLADSAASDWVRNAIVHPEVTIEVGGRSWAAVARLVEPGPEDAFARAQLLAKYRPGGDADLAAWSGRATAAAFDLKARDFHPLAGNRGRP